MLPSPWSSDKSRLCRVQFHFSSGEKLCVWGEAKSEKEKKCVSAYGWRRRKCRSESKGKKKLIFVLTGARVSLSLTLFPEKKKLLCVDEHDVFSFLSLCRLPRITCCAPSKTHNGFYYDDGKSKTFYGSASVNIRLSRFYCVSNSALRHVVNAIDYEAKVNNKFPIDNNLTTFHFAVDKTVRVPTPTCHATIEGRERINPERKCS